MKRLVATLAVIISVLTIALITVGSASATSLPKIQSNGFGNWHSGWKVRPGQIVFGTNFLIKNLRYSHYSQTSSLARGRLLWDTCQPTCASGGKYYNATADFYEVFNHGGPGRNFGYLRLTWPHHSMLLWIDSAGQWLWKGI